MFKRLYLNNMLQAIIIYTINNKIYLIELTATTFYIANTPSNAVKFLFLVFKITVLALINQSQNVVKKKPL